MSSVIINTICFFIFFRRIYNEGERDKKVVSEVSLISFAVFLVHHKIIYKMTEAYMPGNNIISFLWLLAIIILSIVLAKLLFVINRFVLKSKAFKKIENRFVFQKNN